MGPKEVRLFNSKLFRKAYGLRLEHPGRVFGLLIESDSSAAFDNNVLDTLTLSGRAGNILQLVRVTATRLATQFAPCVF